MNASTVWSWIEKNRFTVMIPLVAIILWLIAAGCTPETQSPFDPDKQVTAVELEQDYLVWQKENEITMMKFEAAGKDIERQIENQNKIIEFITTLSSGAVADWPGFVQLFLGGGIMGLLSDNIRKNGVIGGLKRNK